MEIEATEGPAALSLACDVFGEGEIHLHKVSGRSRPDIGSPGVKTELLSAQDPNALLQALAVLRSGGLVAFPTDTVYGVGALVFDGAAVERIYAAKGRPVEKAIPVLLADPADLAKVTLQVPDTAGRLAARFWPGALTLVVPKHPCLPELVSATATVGVRVPDHAVARGLLRAAGPLAVTSANLSGQASPSTAQEVFTQLGGRIALILDGGKTPGGTPSTVVDCSGSEPHVLREGPIAEAEIRAVLGFVSLILALIPRHVAFILVRIMNIVFSSSTQTPQDLGESATGFAIKDGGSCQ